MKNLIVGIAQSLRWSFSLGNKFFRVVPVYTSCAVLIAICSQFFLLAGFLLPLKVVLLLGSENVPYYFPAFLQAVGRDWLIILLSVASVVFYFLHLLTTEAVERCSDLGAVKLLAKSRKMSLFENQEEIALKGYQRYLHSLAGLGFMFVCLLVMVVFYPLLALVIVSYFFISIVVIGMLLSTVPAFGRLFSDGLGTLPKVLGSIGFLFTFAFIVFDYLAWSAPGVLIAVISLLLARQFFGRAANLVKDQHDLYRQKPQLSALFFHGHVFHDDSKRKNRGMWSMIEPSPRDLWIGDVLQRVLDHRVDRFSTRWFQLGVQDVLCYLVTLESGDCEGRVFLIKLFNNNRSAWAKHEATLLTTQDKLPALPFLGTVVVDAMNCHIFEVTGYHWCGSGETTKSLSAFRYSLSSYLPSNELVSLFIRSRPQLWQRFDEDLLNRLSHLLDSDSDPAMLARFSTMVLSIQKRMAKLPLAIQVADIRSGMLWKSVSGDLVLGHWARWELAPVGAGWPFTEADLERVSALWQRVLSSRPDIDHLSLADVRLAALFSEFEARLQRGRYAEAYSLIKPMLTIFDEFQLGI